MLLHCNIIAFTKGFLQGGVGLPGEGYGVKCLVFNIHSQLFGYYSQKNIFYSFVHALTFSNVLLKMYLMALAGPMTMYFNAPLMPPR